jgi:hypothetical protein
MERGETTVLILNNLQNVRVFSIACLGNENLTKTIKNRKDLTVGYPKYLRVHIEMIRQNDNY